MICTIIITISIIIIVTSIKACSSPNKGTSKVPLLNT